MSNCNRCGKKNVEIHTCSPTNIWRKAMDEGYNEALNDVRLKIHYLRTIKMSINSEENYAEYYYDDSLSDLYNIMLKLKKGKSDE